MGRPLSMRDVRISGYRRASCGEGVIRGLSPLSLANRVGSTPRHISFLETGRSRPGRDMVLRLADVLDASLRSCNPLLQAAGIAPAFPEAALQAHIPLAKPSRRRTHAAGG